jgi:hypothetical protein
MERLRVEDLKNGDQIWVSGYVVKNNKIRPVRNTPPTLCEVTDIKKSWYYNELIPILQVVKKGKIKEIPYQSNSHGVENLPMFRTMKEAKENYTSQVKAYSDTLLAHAQCIMNKAKDRVAKLK